MGDFNVSCGASGISMSCDEAVLIPLVPAYRYSGERSEHIRDGKMEMPGSMLVSNEGCQIFFEPLTLPIFGSLNSYGRLENIEKVVHTKMLPLEEKWVITISIQYGCSMGCSFCSPAGIKVNTPHGEKNIESIQIGDFVLGHDGTGPKINEVKELFSREYEGDLICLELENGKTIKLTPNHEVFTKNGIKCASELLDTDELIDF